MNENNPIIEISIGILLIIIGIWMIRKIKIKTFYDIKGFGVGVACLLGGITLLLKVLFYNC
jgi:hypothetical protein